MFIAGLLWISVLAAQVLAQCDRAADCVAFDPWFYVCTDGSRVDYTDCANSCCAAMNSAICSDPVQSYDYDGCMDACSASASASCGTTSTPGSTTSTSTSTTSSSSSSSPTACLLPRATGVTAPQCINLARQACHTCQHGVLRSNGSPVTVDGCGQLQDQALRQIQERKYPLMTKVCNQHDRCFGTCRSEGGLFKDCNDALIAGAYGVCEEMSRDRSEFCLKQGESRDNCRTEARAVYTNCIGELVRYTKLAVQNQRMCKAFNDAQSEFCTCSNK